MANTPATPVVETKREKFVRLATARMNKALAAIAQIRGLTNKSLYDFTDADAEAIGKALEAEVVKTTKALQGEKAQETGFTLSA